MDILEKYYKTFNNNKNVHDFLLFKYKEQLYIGKDNSGHPVIVILSNKPNRSSVRQKTKMLSVECNVTVKYNSIELMFFIKQIVNH